MIERAVDEVQKADVLVVIGTSLNVYPAAGLINYARRGIPIYLIDPNEVRTSQSGITFIQKGASEGVAELRELLRKNQ